jgi:predicted nucleic acid-binding protein
VHGVANDDHGVESCLVRRLLPQQLTVGDADRDTAHIRRRVAQRVAELVEQYADLPLGTSDASVIALAERLEVEEIATLDLRHFTVVRPRHVKALPLLP